MINMDDSAWQDLAANLQAMNERLEARRAAYRSSTTDPMADSYFPGAQWHEIGQGNAYWRAYKHWGTCVWAGEGLEIHNGDRSGCMTWIADRRMTNIPIIVEARIYRPLPQWHAGMLDISAVFSYPDGIGALDAYFWETLDPAGEIERFTGESAEAAMEARILAYFRAAL